MKRQKLEITRPAQIEVRWYDKVSGTPQDRTHQGEVIGWRDSQVIVRVLDYGVIRFWKNSGYEVGNADRERRGFRVDLEGFRVSTTSPPGVEVAIDTFE